MRRELYVPPQTALEPLLPERAGTPFVAKFPKIIPEQPYLGQVFKLSSLSLFVNHTVVLKAGQEEAFPSLLMCSLQLLRNNWVVGVWDLGFQMRLIPGTEGKRWFGEATVYQDLTNAVDYRSGDTLQFAVSGVVPGNIGGPQKTKQEEREEERTEREVELLALQGRLLEGVELSNVTQEEILTEQAETVQSIISLEAEVGNVGNENLELLESILSRLEEME